MSGCWALEIKNFLKINLEIITGLNAYMTR